MPNIANVLKQEIARVARKESKGEIEQAKRAAASHRKQLAQLKRRMDALERQLAAMKKQGDKPAPSSGQESEAPSLRFRPEGLKKHRERLGLSAADAGKLMGVSALSVYKWENGKTRPRAKQLQAIAQLRTLGKREATHRLEQLAS